MIKSLKKNNNDGLIKRKVIVVSLILLFVCLIIIKLFYLQIIKHSSTGNYVNKIVNIKSIQKPRRGFIFDRNGNLLASSIRKYIVFLDGKMIKNKDIEKVRNFLKEYNIEINDNHIEKIKKGKSSYIPIAKGIDETIVLDIQKHLIDGIGFEQQYIRQYPEGRLASHIIGKTDFEGIGTAGIEGYCNGILSGEEIVYKKYTIGNKKIFAEEIQDDENINGKDICLTIDRRLQFILEQELKEALKKTKSSKAVGIIENPNNGEILAMASVPDFDPNGKIKSNEELKNNAVSLVIEPGSTFKIVVLSACLEEKKLKPTDKINCENGKFKVADGYIRDHEKQKIISVARAIEVSSNIGSAKMAMVLESKLFYEYIKKFGFNSKSGIDLNGEEKGLLKEVKNWSGRSLHTISFGQEISTTPLQIINAFCAIANGGTLLKPKIIKSIDNEDLPEKSIVRTVISEETASKVRKILKGVIDNGTGKSAKVDGYSVAGKTGTAQKRDPKTGKYSTEHYYASFCGMIPADKPEIVILVALDEPSGSYYAASVVAPVFNKIAQRALDYLKIPMDEPVVNTKKEKGKK